MSLLDTDDEKIYAAERARLVRLCAWFTGDPDSAEDLAQETLLAAWKNRTRLESPEKMRAWLSGIARNICLNWLRGHARELAHRQLPLPVEMEEALPDGGSLELHQDRADLSRLLEQALSHLPADTAKMLVEHYALGKPQAEIAGQAGMNPGAVGVRLQRGRQALRRTLETTYQSEAVDHGLVSAARPTWDETNIWCPNCGSVRLLGQFQRGLPSGRFALRCPRCNPGTDQIMAGLDLTNPYNAALLNGVKSYKPAYTRLVSALTELYRRAITTLSANCPACGRPAQVQVEHHKLSPILQKPTTEVIIHCHGCGWTSSKTRSAMVMALQEVQRFWRDNPRIRFLPNQDVESQGLPAVVTRMQSVTNTSELAVVSVRETFEVVGLERR